MKKIILILALLLFLVACGADEPQEIQIPVEETPTETPAPAEPGPQEHDRVFSGEPGFQAAKEFLSNFTGMYLMWPDTYIFVANLLGIEAGDGEELWRVLADHAAEIGNPTNLHVSDDLLPDALRNDFSFRGGFAELASPPSFWEIDDSGFPLIGIRYHSMFANGPVPTEFFRFVDGEYTHIGMLEMSGGNFYRDADGRLFVLTGFWSDELEKTFLTITDSAIYTEPVPSAWTEEEFFEMDFEVYILPGLPYAEITIIPDMHDFGEEIRQALLPEVRARFEASFP